MSQQELPAAARVLVVDDDAAAREGARRVLAGAGMAVSLAADGHGCLAAIHESAVDVVLLDVELPDMDGFEVCRRLKLDARTATAFVAFWTARQATPEAIAAGVAAGGECFIARPVPNAELAARVAGLVRHKRSQDALRASEQRYRSLFEGSPQPIWILDAASHRVLAANGAALAHYGYGATEVLALSSSDLFDSDGDAAFWGRSCPAPGTSLSPHTFRQRLKDGTVVEAEVLCYPVQWQGSPARAVFVHDISERLELSHRRRHDDSLLDHELQHLESLSAAPPPVTAQALGVKPLREAAPGLYGQFRKEYDAILERALVEKSYHTDGRVSPALRALAQRLFVLKAGPRDVTELHLEVLRRRLDGAEPRRAAGYVESGRLTVLELMGYLVAAYRNHHVPLHHQAPSPGSAGP